MNEQITINQTLQGYYKVGVVSPDGEVEWKQEGKNLILNQGMDNLYNMSVVDQMVYGICGTGTRPNSKDGGTSQISQSGTLVGISNNSGNITDFTGSFDVYAHLAQVGDYITYADGTQAQIAVVHPNGTNLTVSQSYNTGPQNFTVWKTTQVGLQTEISRSTSYLTGVGNCGTTAVPFVSGSLIHLRTYDFPIVQSLVSYNEIGVGWAPAGATAVFSRILVNPIVVFAGFHLRLIYQLQSNWSQTASLTSIASIGGWPVSPATTLNGTQSVQNFLCSTIATSGASQNSTAVLDPYFVSGNPYAAIFASNNSASLVAFGSAVDRTTNGLYAVSGQMSKAAYAIGQYFVDKTGIITAGSLGSNSLRSIGFGLHNNGYNAASNGQAFCFRFDQGQTLTNLQSLSLTFRQVWSRTLA